MNGADNWDIPNPLETCVSCLNTLAPGSSVTTFLSFEGGGPVRRAFLGAFWLDDTNDFIFRQYLLDEALWPMGGERGIDNEGFWEPADLTNTLEELRQLAEAEDRLVFAYSEHDQTTVTSLQYHGF